MTRPRRTAVVLNANDPQLPQVHVFAESLRDPRLGNFRGDIWVVSTKLSKRSKAYLRRSDIGFLEDPLDFLWDWSGWRTAAYLQWAFLKAEEEKRRPPPPRPGAGELFPKRLVTKLKHYGKETIQSVRGTDDEDEEEQQEPTHEELKDEFCRYRNIRMSKQLFLDFLNLHGKDYDRFIFCDGDILLQSDIEAVLDQVKDDRVYYWREEYPILPGSGLWLKNLAYFDAFPNADIDLGGHEINMGFLAGSREAMLELWTAHRRHYLAEEHVQLLESKWHEQDFVRLIRAEHPDRFELFQLGTVVHLCAGGEDFIRESSPHRFSCAISGVEPVVVHFAGGTWRAFPHLRRAYTCDWELLVRYYS